MLQDPPFETVPNDSVPANVYALRAAGTTWGGFILRSDFKIGELYFMIWHADEAIFEAFCERCGESYLPADPKTIRAFIEHEVNSGKKPATVRRYIATIGRAHVGAGLLNPCSGEAVRLALKKMGRETSERDQGIHPNGR